MKVKINFFLILSLCIHLFISCSFERGPKAPDVEVEEMIGSVEPVWFSGSPAMALLDRRGLPVPHLLFDLTTEIGEEIEFVKYIVETPEGSPVMYGIDQATGRHFSERAFCSQNDIWKDYSGAINEPPFTSAVIPRFLDQLGSPQKMIVFGGKDELYKDFKNKYFEARIIGGYIEQICPKGQCSKVGSWLSRIVLIGIDSSKREWDEIKSVEDLKQVIDWPSVKAFIENGQGANALALEFFPAFRQGAIVDRKKAINYTQDYSIYLTNKKLLAMRKSCLKLYEHYYQNVMRDSKHEESIKSAKTVKELNQLMSQSIEKKSDLFYYRFTKNFRKYAKQFNVCQDYIYPSNINDNPKRHWDFAYLSAVHNLYKLGYGFECSRNIWIDLYGKKNAEKSAFYGCLIENIDNAFYSAPLKLKELYQKGEASYIYIDYDSGKSGTHEKLYQWVYINNKHLQCEDIGNPDYRSERGGLPKDIRWQKRELKFSKGNNLIK